MPDMLDQITQYVDMFTTGQFPIPPWAGTLDGHVPNLNGLIRDDDNIICQPETSDTPGGPGVFPPMHSAHGLVDGGDSAARTGAAAFCNSALDIGLLPKFVTNGIMVRHPKHYPYNNPNNCTRDQLLAFLSGCWRSRSLIISQELLKTHAARGYTCQNYEKDEPGSQKKGNDSLLPDDIMYLHICGGEKSTFTEPYGQLALQAAIQVADRSIGTDRTNLMLECIVCGRLNLFVQVHQNYKEMLRWYFVDDPSGNRQMGPIAEELIYAVDQELKRYPKSIVPLLPTETLKLFRGLNLRAELNNLDQGRHLELAKRFTEATLKDAATTLIGPMKYSLDAATKELKELGASTNTIVNEFAKAGKNPTEIFKALADTGLPTTEVNQVMHAVFPGFVAPPIVAPPIVTPFSNPGDVLRRVVPNLGNVFRAGGLFHH